MLDPATPENRSPTDPQPPIPPPPPPLPSLPSIPHSPRVERPSPFLAKFGSMPKDCAAHIPHHAPAQEPDRYEPVYYFFYGTLMRPDILKHVLDIDHELELRDAKVVGYDVSFWGQYKALVDGEPSQEVNGCSFQVQSPAQEFKLAHYEISAYELALCLINFTDGKEPRQVTGKTFIYAGDSRALKAKMDVLTGLYGKYKWECGCRHSGGMEGCKNQGMITSATSLDDGRAALAASIMRPNEL